MKNKKGVLLTLIGGTFWGLSGACGQYLFQYKNATSDWLVPLRLAIAGFLLLCYLYLRRGNQIFDIWKTKKNALQISVYGIMGMMLCQYSYFTTIQYSNAGIATVIQYLHLVIILLLVCMQRRTLPRPIEMLSLVLALGGTFLLATHGRLNTLVLSGTALIWGLISAGACVFYTLYPANLMKQFDTTLIVGWGMFLGGLVLTLLMRPWTQNVILDGQTFLAFAVIVFFGTILAFSFYLLGVKLIGPSPASMLASIEAVSATILSVVWLKSPFELIDFIGILCIMSTVFLLSIPKKKEVQK